VWNLPILYVCENNQWQAYVSRRETMLTDHISAWARPYGIETRTVDGNDVEAVAAAAREAVAYIRENRKPFFLETYTYRLRGHMEPDTQGYVDQDELAAWKRRDPIATLQTRLVESGQLSAEELSSIKEKVRLVVEEAVSFASDSPYPSFAELTTNVYA
jgi:pyruvate dehydrogenase E1 component alpha subunit